MQNRLEGIIKKEDYRTFFSHLFTLLGAIFLASGVMFFIAYNWEVLGKFFKFGIVELAVVGSFLAAYFLKENSLGFKSAIVVGSFLIGVLLALFGQVYQTGALPYELFMYWALMVLPIALLSRFAGIWILEVVLINFVVYLYNYSYLYEQLFHNSMNYNMLFIVNFVILVFWSLLSKYVDFLNEAYAIRFVATLAFVWASISILIFIIGRDANIITLLVYLIFVLYVFYMYRVKELDIYILSILLLSVNIVVVASVVRLTIYSGIMGMLFTSSIVAIVCGYLSVSWLNTLSGDVDEK